MTKILTTVMKEILLILPLEVNIVGEEKRRVEVIMEVVMIAEEILASQEAEGVVSKVSIIQVDQTDFQT